MAQIVTQDSANLCNLKEQAIGLQANHGDMVRFGTAESPNFKLVSRQIEELVSAVLHSPSDSMLILSSFNLCY